MNACPIHGMHGDACPQCEVNRMSRQQEAQSKHLSETGATHDVLGDDFDAYDGPPAKGETPRTDALAKAFANPNKMTEHARTLERELALAIATISEEQAIAVQQQNRAEAAESALAAAVLDAERYRWLRNSINQSEAPFIAIRSPSHIVGQLKGEYADQYIDAARKEGQ